MILILNCCWSVKHTTESEGKDPSSSSEINMSHYMDTNSSLIDCRQKFCLFICFFFAKSSLPLAHENMDVFGWFVDRTFAQGGGQSAYLKL